MVFETIKSSSELQVVETLHGPMACFRNDTGVSQSLRNFGEFGSRELAIYNDLLEPGELFIDIGANIGYFSAALSRMRHDIEVLAFEPQLSFFSAANFNLFGKDRVKVFPYAVGDDDGFIDVPEIDLRQQGNYGGFQIFTASERTLPVPMVRLDSFLKKRGKLPKLIKIDVEGMERHVIDGLSNILNSGQVISVEADRVENVREWLPKLLDMSAKCYFVNMRSISSKNPSFDINEPRCNVFSPHIFAFIGEIDQRFHDQHENFVIADMSEYEDRFLGS